MQQAENGRLRVVTPGDRRESKRNADGNATAKENAELPSPGTYIREQREARGLSLAELATATKIPRSSLELLEDDCYGELPGPVFVKGFFRCCARSLGMDADEVMELLYERERAQLQARKRERTPAAPPAEDKPSAEPPVPRMPPKVRRSAAPPRRFGFGELLARAPSISLLLWVVIAVFVAMVMAAAFNLMGQGPTGPT